MFNENENVNLPMETDNPSNINEKKLGQEEKKSLQRKIRKRKFNDVIMKQQEDDEEQEEGKRRRRPFDYENLSDDEIKERLFKTFNCGFEVRFQVYQWLETDRTLLLFIRQHASLLAKYSSLKMELELYQGYIKMTESILPWLSTMSKTLLTRNNINSQFFQIQKYINKQLKDTEAEFGMMTEKLAKFMSDQQQMSSSSKVDMKLLTSLIAMFVREDQQRLNVEFMKKRHLLMLNAKDVCLVHEFYYLQPDSQQLQIAENIWQATIDEQRTKNNISNNQQSRFKSVDYGHQIEIQKEMLLALNKKDKDEKYILPINYSKLNIDLLMNIIESRQKILIQRLEFEHDFNQIFLISDDDDDSNDNDYEDNVSNSNKKMETGTIHKNMNMIH